MGHVLFKATFRSASSHQQRPATFHQTSRLLRGMGALLSSPSTSEFPALHTDAETVRRIDEHMHHAAANGEMSSPVVSEKDMSDFGFPKVELHLHLDGSVRFTTLLEVSKDRGIPIKNKKGEVATTIEEVKKMLVTNEPANLAKMLAPFEIFLPVIRGDVVVVERIAYEMCEDQKENGVIYFEGRYAPHLLCGEGVTAADVVEAVHRGFTRGEQDFGVKARSILCAIRGLDEYTDEILELATDLKHFGVVAIDVAGSAHGADEQYEPNVVHIFQEANKRGIHRTVHAGESGGPKEVIRALTDMHAERIGHGYRIMLDEDLYQTRFLDDKSIHLEACPYSSVMTGSVPLKWPEHPVATWAKDDVNFSISRDDPTCFDNTMFSELALAHHEIGVTVHQLWKAQLNAARACFLPDDEKHAIVDAILAAEPKH